MALLAGFKALLWRYTSQKDIVVEPTSPSQSSGTEDLIGLL